MRVCCTLAIHQHDLRATTLHSKAKRRLSSQFSPTELFLPHFISFHLIAFHPMIFSISSQKVLLLLPMRSVAQDSKTPYNYAHTHKHAQSTVKPHQHCATNHMSKRPQPQPPRTRGTFHCRPEPLYTEKKLGFVPKLSTKTKPMQHPCSH